MPKSKRKPVASYDFLSVEVEKYSVYVSSSISPKVRHKSDQWENPRVHESYTALEISGVLKSAEGGIGPVYTFSVYGDEQYHGQYSMRLSDCQARDDRGLLKYGKARGEEIPIYDIPKGIGYHRRGRGTQEWFGTVWVPPRTVTDMLTLLPHVRPLYLFIHELKIERRRVIVGLTLQTCDPWAE